MRVAFIAAECEPFAKTGGLGDVVDALARALGRTKPSSGIEPPVDVYLPCYRGIIDCADAVRTTLRVPDPRAEGGLSDVGLVTFDAEGYRVRLVDAPAAFDRAGLYGPPADGDYPDNAWRFGLLCRTALEAIRADADAGRVVDLVHLHDWHAAPTLLYRDGPAADVPAIARLAAVQTLHNLAYHGWTPNESLDQLGLGPYTPVAAGTDGTDLLREGVLRSEIANTVSPTYAAEALTSEYGFGLQAALAAKGDRFVGILNGLDLETWNPATDETLPATYDMADRTGKAACRRDLLARIGFDPDDPSPVVGMIGRLDPQKGFDLLAAAAPRLLDDGARIVVLGSGDSSLAKPFRALAAARPDGISLNETFDRGLARRIYAGADVFAMPSRFEPSGQGQMIAMRYGTPPVARATGGLVDSVVDEAERPGAGTGFLFGPATPTALAEACETAFAVRGRNGDAPGWQRLLDRAMAVDLSWERTAAWRYVEAYRRAIAIRARR
ncbi:MAG TPA: glycogen/starch synthase [Candidatus Limnocylindrales bacterium]|nr:glycogen/starch synthase [Candidatus Limnocylindrales bacterium]